MIEQIPPSDFCLACQGCCKFSEPDSVWSPCLLPEEVQSFVQRGMGEAISAKRRIHLIAHPLEDGYICPFLRVEDHKCSIYFFRPIECQLYPFLLNVHGEKIFLSIALNCPYVLQYVDTIELRQYAHRLASSLRIPQYRSFLQNNCQVYEDVVDIEEV